MVQLSRTRLVASEFKVQESSVNYVGVNGSISYVLNPEDKILQP